MSLGDYVKGATLESRRIAEAMDSARVVWGGDAEATLTANQYLIVTPQKMSRLLDGQRFAVRPAFTNSGAATLAIINTDGSWLVIDSSAKSIKRADGSTALSAGDIVQDISATLEYDEANDVFRLLTLAASSSGGFVSDAGFDATWNGVTGIAPSKNAVYDLFFGIGGVWTPTLTNVANVDSSTTYQSMWARIANNVLCAGYIDVDPTAGATITQVGVSLPIASNLGAVEDLCGGCSAAAIAGESGAVFGDTANDRANIHFVCASTSSHSLFYWFMYRVI